MYVEPPHLRGYARQLEALSTDTFPDMRKHCEKYCVDPKAWDGMLALAEEMFSNAGSAMSDLLSKCEKGSGELADGLTKTADSYWDTDHEHSDSIEATEVPVYLADGSARTDHISTNAIVGGGREEVASGYKGAPSLDYDVPKPDTEFIDWVANEIETMFEGFIMDKVGKKSAKVGAISDIVSKAGGEVGEIVSWFDADAGKSISDSTGGLATAINDLIKWFTGYDLCAKLTEAVVGDPSAITAVSVAWANLESGFTTISGELGEGVETLDERWNSESGGISEKFCDQTVREGWIPAFDALADLAFQAKVSAESLALVYRHVIRSAIVIAKFYMSKIKKVLKAIQAGEDVVGGVKLLIDLVKELWDFVCEAWDAIVRQCEMVIDDIKMLWGMIKTIWHSMQGDLDILETV